jgi:hypothetical protein
LSGEFNEDVTELLDDNDLWRLAVDYLESFELITLKKAAFGPPLLIKTNAFDERWALLCEQFSPFDHYSAIGEEQQGWLFEALRDVLATAVRLEITSDDYDTSDSEWTPIKLDRDDPTVVNAIEKLSNAVDEIRKDNGYAANFPEERDFVVDGLSRSVDKLTSGTISAGYVRDAWNRLALVSRRFSGAAMELVLTGAKQAIIEFVKSQGGELLRNLLHLFH